MKQNSDELMMDLANFRVLTAKQVSALGDYSDKTANRNLAKLLKEGFACQFCPTITGKKGRPPACYTLTEEGAKWLQERIPTDDRFVIERVPWNSTYHLNHQLFLNDVGIHFRHFDTSHPEITVNFHSSTSPFLSEDVASLLHPSSKPESVEISGTTKAEYPDAVVVMTQIESGASLLSFVEVDRGRESLTGRTNPEGLLAVKVQKYQTSIVTQDYKKYQETLGASFNGFRVLFVADSENRAQRITNLFHNMTPPDRPWMTDFVWVTWINRIDEIGLDGPIWSKGIDPERGHCLIPGREKTL